MALAPRPSDEEDPDEDELARRRYVGAWLVGEAFDDLRRLAGGG